MRGLATNRTKFFATVLILANSGAFAAPSIRPGDLAVRHDIQRLADYGVISGPVSTWPLAWGPILADVENFVVDTNVPADVVAALIRIKSRSKWETATAELHFRAGFSASDKPARIRSFQNTPREDGEILAGISWIGERMSMDLTATGTSDPSDGTDVRGDGSEIAIAFGNMTLAASIIDRWWGPGWDGSLVLSNNARPIPAITLDRRFTAAPKSRWLHWLGTYDFSVIWGQLEEDRAVPNARFVAARFNFRPIPSLEIGLSRSAQWCGNGRPCDVDTFAKLLLGKDNRGDDDVTFANEPGNQTAGVDVRWSTSVLRRPVAIYGQFLGEDEAGGFPSRYLGQIGIEGTAYLVNRWSMRSYAEVAATTCDFWKSEKIYNCAYNHRVYQSGYRYRGRSIGHAADNDARVVSFGTLLVDSNQTSWHGLIRIGKLNRGGPADPANSLTPLPLDLVSAELIHERVLRFGTVNFGLGYDRFDGNQSIPSSNEARAFIQWRSD